METSEHSQLPEFEVKLFHIDEPAGSYDMLEVRCTRTGCGQDHWVGLAWRVLHEVAGRPDELPALIVGRPCPYCSRVSAIPEAWRVFPSAVKQSPKRKRVVRRRKQST